MYERSKSKANTGMWVTLVLASVLVPSLAAVNAFVGMYAALPYVALAAAVLIFVLPLNVLVLLCFVSASVVAGLLEYFAGISQAFWLPYLMGLLFGLRALFESFRAAPYARGTKDRSVSRPRVHVTLVFAAVFLCVVAFGTAVAAPPLPQLVVAVKNYLFLWGLLFVLLKSPWRMEHAGQLWTAVIVVVVAQIPVVLYQRFVVAARRHDAAAWDAVVGTFGGSPTGGGQSAAMALTCCLAIAVLLWRHRERRIGAAQAVVLALFCLAPIGLAEVKAAFIWLAVVFGLFVSGQFIREPVRATIALIFGVVLLGGLGLIYKSSMYEGGGSGGTSLADIYDKQIKYAVDPYEYRADFGRLGRVAALVYWSERHSLASDPLRMLVGHGAGASRSSSSFGAGEVARTLPIQVDISAASTLLWDTGLLGAISFTAMLIAGAWSGLRQSMRTDLSPALRETSFLSSALLAMTALGMLYNRDPIDTPVVQMLIFFSLAQVLLARRALFVGANAAPSLAR